jgi:hypothetical protein
MTTGVAMDARSYLGMLLGVASCISNLLARQQDLTGKDLQPRVGRGGLPRGKCAGGYFFFCTLVLSTWSIPHCSGFFSGRQRKNFVP